MRTPKFKPGDRFGAITVDSYAGSDRGKNKFLNLVCDCGAKKMKSAKDFSTYRTFRHDCSAASRALKENERRIVSEFYSEAIEYANQLTARFYRLYGRNKPIVLSAAGYGLVRAMERFGTGQFRDHWKTTVKSQIYTEVRREIRERQILEHALPIDALE